MRQHKSASLALALVCLTLQSCNGRSTSKPVQTWVQKISCLANQGECVRAVDAYETVPASLKQDVARELNSHLLHAGDQYWLIVGLRLGLADRRTFRETVYGGDDTVLLSCMKYSLSSATDWQRTIGALSARWGSGSWDWLYDAAAWGSMGDEDFRNWSTHNRELLFELLLRSLRERQEHEATWSVYEVVGRAFDVKGVSGRSISDFVLACIREKQPSGSMLADWLEANRGELLRRDPPPRPENARAHAAVPRTRTTRGGAPSGLPGIQKTQRTRGTGGN